MRLPRQLASRLQLASAVQLVLVGAALGLLGYSTGRRTGLERAAALERQYTITQLSNALSQRLASPRTAIRSSMLAIRQGSLSLNDFDALGQQFWRQMKLYPIGYINYGTSSGDFIGVERLDSGELVLNEDSARPLGRGNFGVYTLGANGRRGALREVVPGMETFHQEAWYADTVRAGRPGWSSIYQWEDKPEVFSISYNEPVVDARGRLLGVIGADFVLSQLSQWLQQVWRGQSGLALIVEPDGRVVASSRPELTLVQQGQRRLRARLGALNDPMARLAARTYLPPGSQRLQLNAAAPHQLAILEGRPYLLDAAPWGQAEGLNWLLITATAQEPALAQIRRQELVALLLGLGAISAAVLITRWLILWLLAPMAQLRHRALTAIQQLRQHAPEPPQFEAALPAGSASELAGMARAFGLLVARLRQSQRQLAQAAQRERLREAEAQELLKLKLRSSLEASAVAHEINLPLSQVLLNSRLLLEQSQQGAQLPVSLQPLVHDIAASATQVVSTIEKMRSLLRNVQTRPQPLNLAHVARSALLYMQPGLNKAGVQLESSGLAHPCPLEGDSAQLQIALVNLLRNSLEALQSQEPGQRRIRLSLRIAEREAVLSVEDNGPGFPADRAVLEPLETSRSSGSGLGLFVVQSTLRNHQGRVVLGTSSLGGALVELHLPLPSTG
jgi:signal transduction histidine kinase